MSKIDFLPHWWDWAEIKQMREAWKNQPICFIGGALRDAMVDLIPHDFDMYTPLEPEETLRLLTNAGIEAQLYSVFFGRVVATINDARFEIATSKDRFISEDAVDFVAKMGQYASTYDFTINSLFIDNQGNCYSNFGGAEDIRDGRVRFMSDPLRSTIYSPERILRFFRLHAWFGKGAPDEAGYAACLANSELLMHVTATRRGTEMVKLFGAKHFASTLAYMDQREILPEIFGVPLLHHTWLQALEDYELEYSISPRAPRHLALLVLSLDLPWQPALTHLRQTWNLRNRDCKEVNLLLRRLPHVDANTDVHELDKLGLSQQQFNDIQMIRHVIGEDLPAEKYLP